MNEIIRRTNGIYHYSLSIDLLIKRNEIIKKIKKLF